MTKEEIAKIIEEWWHDANSRGDKRLTSVQVTEDVAYELHVETADGQTKFIEVQDV